MLDWNAPKAAEKAMNWPVDMAATFDDGGGRTGPPLADVDDDGHRLERAPVAVEVRAARPGRGLVGHVDMQRIAVRAGVLLALEAVRGGF